MRTSIPSIFLALIAIGGHAAEPAIPQPPQPDVLFYLNPDGTRPLPLEQQVPVMRPVKSFAAADFQGPASPFRISTRRPTFVIRLARTPDKSRDRLMLVASVNGKRTILLSQGPNKTGIPLPGKDVEMEYRSSGPNTFALRPIRLLAPGEYAINFSTTNLTFLFGVEPGATTPEEPTAESRSGTDPQPSRSPRDEKRQTLDTLLQKGLITEADHKAKLAELAAPPVAPGPEDRLRKLDDLLKRGLISQPEYQNKRAQILAEI
jgi:hypothetical protein